MNEFFQGIFEPDNIKLLVILSHLCVVHAHTCDLLYVRGFYQKQVKNYTTNARSMQVKEYEESKAKLARYRSALSCSAFAECQIASQFIRGVNLTP